MAYRSIFVSSASKISLRNQQLIIKTDEEYSFPLEDVSSIMLENNQSNLSAAVLSECAKKGVLIYFCDEKYLPCGVITGFNTHSRKHKILQAQIQMKETLKKHLWTKVASQKIRNQAEVLKLLNLTGYEQIVALSKKVKLNDKDNMEAVAAA